MWRAVAGRGARAVIYLRMFRGCLGDVSSGVAWLSFFAVSLPALFLLPLLSFFELSLFALFFSVMHPFPATQISALPPARWESIIRAGSRRVHAEHLSGLPNDGRFPDNVSLTDLPGSAKHYPGEAYCAFCGSPIVLIPRPASET